MATENTAARPAEPPTMAELSPREDLLNPIERAAAKVADPYVTLLTTEDSVLQAKGGHGNLKIYTELLRDDQVATAWGQRRLALTSCETVVEPGADDAASKAAADALRAELEALDWDGITEKMLFAAFYGWGVAEILWAPGRDGRAVSFGGIKVRDRARFRTDVQGGVYLWVSTTGWVQMPPKKFWWVTHGADNSDQPYGLGLAHQLYWPVFFKRNDVKFWLVFLERFGQPTAIAKLTHAQIMDTTIGADGKTNRQRALEMLRQIATDAGVVVPADDERGNPVVSLLEAARSGAADYEALVARMNEAISKVVVGQTMTVDNGSSRSQAEVHAGVKQQLVASDSDLLCGTFNDGPVQWWTEWNFPGATAPKVYRHTEPPEDLNARAERDSKIKALGYEPTEDYITETYGDGWQKSQAPAMPGGPGMPNPGAAAQFAEGELAALQALRAARRGDQQALADAAVMFAEQYDTLMGRRVGQILQAAEFADNDPELFRQRLNEILEEGPEPAVVEKVGRAGLFARMMGALRAQRRAA
jgi:phage gp29-like protein